MSKTYKELKSKIAQLRGENSFLTSKVEKVLLENGRVKRELQVSNARIVELAQEIELLKTSLRLLNYHFKENTQELELLKNGLPFADEVKEALSNEPLVLWEYEVSHRANNPSSSFLFSDNNNHLIFDLLFGKPKKKKIKSKKVAKERKLRVEKYESEITAEKVIGAALKKMIENNVAFSSMFVPNVKFSLDGSEENLISVLPYAQLKAGCKYFKITSSFEIIGAYQEIVFRNWNEKEVSIYEAIPELVPNGMVYDKESDSLVKKS